MKNTQNNNTMANAQAFTNIYGEVISFTPFFHNACNVWRIAKNVNGELEQVYENKAFDSVENCSKACIAVLSNLK